MKKILLILLFPICLFGQIKIKDLPTTTTGTLQDYLLKDFYTGAPGATQKITVYNFLNTYSLTIKNIVGAVNDRTVTITAIGSLTVTGSYPNFTLTIGTGNAFINGGNSFGGNATIGLNDNFGLSVKTNSVVRANITNAGYIGIGQSGQPGNQLSITSLITATFTTTKALKLLMNNDVVVGGTSIPLDIQNSSDPGSAGNAYGANILIEGINSGTIIGVGINLNTNTSLVEKAININTSGYAMYVNSGLVNLQPLTASTILGLDASKNIISTSVTISNLNNFVSDRTVTITAIGTLTVTGSYPNFTLSVGTGNAYVKGGNSFGSDSYLGLKDAFVLSIGTNSITAIQLTGTANNFLADNQTFYMQDGVTPILDLTTGLTRGFSTQYVWMEPTSNFTYMSLDAVNGLITTPGNPSLRSPDSKAWVSISCGIDDVDSWKGLVIQRYSNNQAYNMFEVQDENGAAMFMVNRNGNPELADGHNLLFGSSSGGFIGASTAKIAFYGATPIVQPSAVTTAQGIADALTNLGLIASSTITATSLSATATLNFGSTAAGASSDLTITVTGAADGDPVTVGVPNGSTLANGVFTGWVSAANTVKVRFTNTNLVTALDPASGTFKATVIK